MSVLVGQLLDEHSTNLVEGGTAETGTNKAWTKDFEPIANVTVHTYSSADELTTYANWDAMLPLQEDDQLRMNNPASPPNRRRWYFGTEEDCGVWFHAEVSSIVLAAWNDYPAVTQTCQPKPPSGNDKEMVDIVYALSDPRLGKRPLAIGEWKRNTIKPKTWRDGNPGKTPGQKKLSRELRGYAVKYKCPQVFCFDGQHLLLLQFRATTPTQLANKDCPVDCWILPRINQDGGCSLRLGLYRLLTQGFRRCQGLGGLNVPVNGHNPVYREWFSGCPVFQDKDNAGKFSYNHPDDGPGTSIDRRVNINDGSSFWQYNGAPMYDENGLVVDTDSTWGFV